MLGNTSTVLPGPGPGASCRASAMDSAFTFPSWPGLSTYQVSAMGNEFTGPVQGRIVSSERDRHKVAASVMGSPASLPQNLLVKRG